MKHLKKMDGTDMSLSQAEEDRVKVLSGQTEIEQVASERNFFVFMRGRTE